MSQALQDLLDLLDLERIEEDIFRGQSAAPPSSPASSAGRSRPRPWSPPGRTVPEDRPAHSLHAYFLRAGRPRRADRLHRRPHPRRPLLHHPPGRRRPARPADLPPLGVLPDVRGGPGAPGADAAAPGPGDAAHRRGAACAATRHLRRPERRRAAAGGPRGRRPALRRRAAVRHASASPANRAPRCGSAPTASSRDDPLLHVVLATYVRLRHDAAGLGAARPRARRLGRRRRRRRLAWTTRCGSTARSAPTSGCCTTRSRPSASGGRGLGQARIYTQDGRLAVSVIQEGVVRVPRPKT